MENTTEENKKMSCFTEYDVLKRVILCQPEYMTIREMINETQKYFKNEGIHIEKALEQHNELINTLRNNDIDVILLPNKKKYQKKVLKRKMVFPLEKPFLLQIWLVK